LASEKPEPSCPARPLFIEAGVPTGGGMDRSTAFDEWWSKKFDFQKFTHPLYKPLKNLCARGGDPDYLLKLVRFFDEVERPMAKAVQEKRSSRKRIDRPRISIKDNRDLFRHFAWWVILETMPIFVKYGRNLFFESLRGRSSTLRSEQVNSQSDQKRIDESFKAYLTCLEDAAGGIDRAIEKTEAELTSVSTEQMKKLYNELLAFAKDARAMPLGGIVYDYKLYPMNRSKKPSAAWDTFFLLAVTEHLRDVSENPHYLEAARLLEKVTFRKQRTVTNQSRPARLIRKNSEQLIANLKKKYPNWKDHIKQLHEHFRPS
jgi:hypothetical protein